MNNTDTSDPQLRILELKKQLLEVELETLERQVGNNNSSPIVDVKEVSEKVSSDVFVAKTSEKARGSTKAKRVSGAPAVKGAMTLGEACLHLGVKSTSSTLVNNLAKKYKIPTGFMHGRKYIQVSKEALTKYYQDHMKDIGKAPRVKRLPNNFYSMKEICGWMGLKKPTHTAISNLLGSPCTDLKRVHFKGTTHFYIEDKEKALNNYGLSLKDAENQMKDHAMNNFHKGIKQIKGDRLTMTDIMGILSDVNKNRCTRSYAEKFVKFMDLGDQVEPHYHKNGNSVKLYFYDITEDFVKAKHDEYLSTLFGNALGDQSEMDFSNHNVSIFSEDYPWIVHDQELSMVLPRNSLDNVDYLDDNCVITFMKDSNPLSVKVSSLDGVCQQAIFNFLRNNY